VYLSRTTPTTDWRSWVKEQFFFLFLSVVWILFCVVFLGEWIMHRFEFSGFKVAFIKLIVEVAVSSPALWFVGVELFINKKARVFWNSTVQYRVFLSVFAALRVGLLVAALTFMVAQSWGIERGVLGAILGFVLMIFFLSTYLEKVFVSLLKLFQDNTQVVAAKEEKQDPFMTSLKNLSPDFGLVPIEVLKDAELVGQSLADLKVRENYQISVVRIDRDGKTLFSPPDTLKILC
jgi:hypothetical protein